MWEEFHSVTQISITLYLPKSRAQNFSLSRARNFNIFGGKAIERAGALEPTTRTGKEKRRTTSLKGLREKTRKYERQNLRGLTYFQFKKENIFFTTLQGESFLKPRKKPTFRDATSFHAKWRLRNVRNKSVLMTCHYPDLSSASERLRHISYDQSEALLRYG